MVHYPSIGVSYIVGLGMCIVGFHKLTPVFSHELHKDTHKQLHGFSRDVWGSERTGEEWAVGLGLYESTCGVFFLIPVFRKFATWGAPPLQLAMVITHLLAKDGGEGKWAVLLALTLYLVWATWSEPFLPPPERTGRRGMLPPRKRSIGLTNNLKPKLSKGNKAG